MPDDDLQGPAGEKAERQVAAAEDSAVGEDQDGVGDALTDRLRGGLRTAREYARSDRGRRDMASDELDRGLQEVTNSDETVRYDRCWWVALGTGALTLCRLVCALQADPARPDAVAPAPFRLKAGLSTVAVALASGAVVPLTAGPSTPVVLGAGGLLLTAAGCVPNLRDPIGAHR